MKICVYAICKNEEKFVERWYNSVKKADLIIVGDTGSKDKTINKLKKLGVIVHKINIKPWRFDNARNAVLNLIPKDIDICVSIDLDEVFESNWFEIIKKSWKKNTTRLKYNYNWSLDEHGKPLVSFLREQIHNRNDYIWINPVHEILKYIGKNKECIDYAKELTLNHYPDNKKSRSQYLPLLELSVKEDPENDRNTHYLGREYMYYKEWDKSIETLKKHLNLKTATWKDERCASMRYIARCYQNKNNYEKAKKWLCCAINEAAYLREPYVELAFLEYNQKKWEECLFQCLNALKIEYKNNSYINETFAWDSTLYDLISICYYNLNDNDNAIKFAKRALAMDENNERIKTNLLYFENQK